MSEVHLYMSITDSLTGDNKEFGYFEASQFGLWCRNVTCAFRDWNSLGRY
jgi:hypothetical protein